MKDLDDKDFIELLDDRVTLFRIMSLVKKYSNDFEMGGRVRTLINRRYNPSRSNESKISGNRS